MVSTMTDPYMAAYRASSYAAAATSSSSENHRQPSLVALSSVSGGSSTSFSCAAQADVEIREALCSTRSLLDLHEDTTTTRGLRRSSKRNNSSQQQQQDMAQRLLAAKMHLQERGGFTARSNSSVVQPVVETQSCFSTPGRPYLTLKEKLSRISRNDNDRTRAPGPHRLEHRNSILAEPERHDLSPISSISATSSDYDHVVSKGSPRSGAGGRSSTNTISLNIYDLIAKDTLMQLPWGCMCEIGKCFNDVNSALHELGTGAYHVGVEVNGIEYAFGATNIPGKSGVFSCIPRLSPGYQYRTTIHFGERTLIRRSWVATSANNSKDDNNKLSGSTKKQQQQLLPSGGSDYKQVESFVDGRQVIKEMVPDYMGADYDILRKNCCTFARDACLRLGIREDEIPSWFGNLAESGALAQDVANSTFEPLRTVLSSCEEGFSPEDELNRDSGFEVISKKNTAGTKEVVLVVPAKRLSGSKSSTQQLPGPNVRRTLTWSY